ncbi:MAG: YbjN domain-containing protein [Treponema sp.]|nr:YbjN domain-containing protein [Treponema sp.]
MAENKIEQFLIDLKYSYREVNPNLWLLDDTNHNLEGIAVMYAEPLVIISVQVMDAPHHDREEFYAKLLELNASEMIHGAYGLEGGKVVIIDTLEYDDLDYSEFRAALDAISLALTQHYPILSVYREKQAKRPGA